MTFYKKKNLSYTFSFKENKMLQKRTLLETYNCSMFSRKSPFPLQSIIRSKIIKSLPITSEEEQQNIQVDTLPKFL